MIGNFRGQHHLTGCCHILVYEEFAQFEVILASYLLRTKGEIVTVGINENTENSYLFIEYKLVLLKEMAINVMKLSKSIIVQTSIEVSSPFSLKEVKKGNWSSDPFTIINNDNLNIGLSRYTREINEYLYLFEK